MKKEVKAALENAFGQGVILLHFDRKSKLVMSKRTKYTGTKIEFEEFMIHKLYNHNENFSLENGSYFDNFEDTIKKYLERVK